MSDNRLTIGWMAELKNPISKDNWGEIHDEYDQAGIGLNYEGTLVYVTVISESMSDGFRLHFLDAENADMLINAMNEKGIAIKMETAMPFVDLWYDSADSNHSDITLKQFKQKTGS